MTDLKLFMCITEKQNSEAYINYIKKCGAYNVLTTRCMGTSSKKMLDFLGLEDTEKVILQTFLSAAEADLLMKRLIFDMGLGSATGGIALTLPIDGIGGRSSLCYLTDKENISSEVKKMEATQYTLITVIAERGSMDTVMDAARSAGARGGTLIKAKGTGADLTSQSKFFGMSIADEKEIIYIVAKMCDRDAIMRAVMENAGMNTDCHAAVFSLPVESISGLRSVLGDTE